MTPKNGVDRLKAARAAQAETSKQIAKLEMQRSGALLADDDDKAAELDCNLDELRRLARRHVDKIALLGPVMALEEQQRRIPPNLDDARARVTQLLQQQNLLTRKNRLDRSAVDDHELQVIASELDVLGRHVSTMERTR